MDDQTYRAISSEFPEQLIQDVALRPAAGFEATQQPPAIPFQYQAIQAPPPVTGNPNVDAAIQLVGPTVARTFLGMVDPVQNISTRGGISALDAYAARDVNGPYYQRFMERLQTETGMGVGSALGTAADTFGISKLLNMRQGEMGQKLMAAGGSQFGQAAMQFAFENPTIRALAGGNPITAGESVFARKQTYGLRAREFSDMLDPYQQMELTRHAEDLNRSLSESIRGTNRFGNVEESDPITGQKTMVRRRLLGLSTNPEFTKGFSENDIKEFVLPMMAEKNATIFSNNQAPIMGGMRGRDVPTSLKTGAVGDTLGALRSLGDLMGSDDMQQIFASFDKLTQGQWAQLDPRQLQQTFRMISASADALNVTKGEMLQTISDIQSTIPASVGLTQGQRAIGMTGGGLGGLMTSQYVAENVMAVKKDFNPRGLSAGQITAQQAGLLSQGLNTKQGRDIQVIEYLRQTGQLDSESYAQFQASLSGGSKSEQLAVKNMVYTKVFGDAARGDEIARNEGMMAQIREKITDPTGRRIAQNIGISQANEYTERMMQVGMQNIRRTTRAVAKAGDVNLQVDPGKLATRQLSDLTNQLRGMGQGTEAEALQAVFERTGGGSKGIQAVREIINTSPRFKQISGRLNETLKTTEDLMQSDLTGPGAVRAIINKTFVDEAGRSKVDPAGVKELAKLGRAREKMRVGGASDADMADIDAQIAKQQMAISAKMTPVEREMMSKAVGMATADAYTKQDLRVAERNSVERMNLAKGAGLTTVQALGQSAKIMEIIKRNDNLKELPALPEDLSGKSLEYIKRQRYQRQQPEIQRQADIAAIDKMAISNEEKTTLKEGVLRGRGMDWRRLGQQQKGINDQLVLQSQEVAAKYEVVGLDMTVGEQEMARRALGVFRSDKQFERAVLEQNVNDLNPYAGADLPQLFAALGERKISFNQAIGLTEGDPEKRAALEKAMAEAGTTRDERIKAVGGATGKDLISGINVEKLNAKQKRKLQENLNVLGMQGALPQQLEMLGKVGDAELMQMGMSDKQRKAISGVQELKLESDKKDRERRKKAGEDVNTTLKLEGEMIMRGINNEELGKLVFSSAKGSWIG